MLEVQVIDTSLEDYVTINIRVPRKDIISGDAGELARKLLAFLREGFPEEITASDSEKPPSQELQGL